MLVSKLVTARLVINDAPRVRDELIVLIREGVVPRARRAKGVAADVEVGRVWYGLAQVNGRKRRQSAT